VRTGAGIFVVTGAVVPVIAGVTVRVIGGGVIEIVAVLVAGRVVVSDGEGGMPALILALSTAQAVNHPAVVPKVLWGTILPEGAASGQLRRASSNASLSWSDVRPGAAFHISSRTPTITGAEKDVPEQEIAPAVGTPIPRA
jgi:hypothetical protein